MGTKIEYIDSADMLFASNYIRNSKAISVLWAVFTICYAIISAVAFLTPEWVGDLDSENAGRLGLWQVCLSDDTAIDNCQKQFNDIFGMTSLPFQVATIFVGTSVLIASLTIFTLVLMFFMETTTVFHICGWMQILSAICMVVGCIAFPFGWNSNEFRKICGPESNRFELGLCGIRWAYPLAIIGCIDGCILGTLAFILATRHVRFRPESLYQGSIYKGEVNNAYLTDVVSTVGSNKSMNLQPVLLVTQPHHHHNHLNQHSKYQHHSLSTLGGDDTISQFSSRTTATASNHHRYNHRLAPISGARNTIAINNNHHNPLQQYQL